MKYVHYDASGNILGFYSDEIHLDRIPAGSIPISDDDWQECLQNQGFRKIDLKTKKIIYCVPPLPPIEELFRRIRNRRNILLAESDWVMLPDVVMQDALKNQWIAYRKALRDLPETCDPISPNWPIKPG